MKNIIVGLLLILAFTNPVYGQDQTSTGNRFLNFGVGVSDWGIPIYMNLESPIDIESSTISVGFSYQFKNETERYYWYLSDVTWRHAIIGIDGSWNYYVDELLGLPDNLNLYGGVGFGYWIWRTKVHSAYNGFSDTYSGTGSGGLGVSYVLGGRYLFKDRLGLNVQFGGGTILSAGKIGLSLQL